MTTRRKATLAAASTSAIALLLFAQTAIQDGYDIRNYAWSRTNGVGASGDLSSAGAKSVTLSPCPKGLVANTSQVRISGGTGTAEVATITSVSTGTNCTVAFTTVNSHSGAWIAADPTAGIQGALNLAGDGLVKIPAGIHEIYAPFTSTTHAEVVCASREGSILRNRSTTTGVARFVLPLMSTATKSGRFANCSIIAGSGVFSLTLDESTGDAIYVEGANHGFTIENVTIKNHSTAISIYESLYMTVRNFTIFYYKNFGIHVNAENNGTTGGIWIEQGAISNSGHLGTANPDGAGIYARRAGGLYVRDVDLTAGPRNVVIQPQAGETVLYGFFTNVLGDSAEGHNWVIDGTAGVVKTIHCTGCWAAYAGGEAGVFSSASNGLVITGSNVDVVNWNGGRIRENGGTGAQINGGTNISFDGVEVCQNGQLTDNTYHGFGFAAGVSDWSVTDSTIGDCGSSASNGQSYGISIAAGGTDRYLIEGNRFVSNQTGTISNGATGTSRVIANNIGIDNVVPTVASAASIAVPLQKTFKVSGTTQITTVTGIAIGECYTMIFIDDAPGGTGTGGNIKTGASPAKWAPVRLCSDGTDLF